MAVARAPGGRLIHHSDSAGSSSASRSVMPPPTPGSPIDGIHLGLLSNATAGTFFATLTKELINGCSWSGREEPRRRVLDSFVIFDNATRRHSTLGVLSPACCEEQNESLKQLNDIDNN
jgi:hypothetical protein